MTNDSRKPLHCRLGLHMSWFTDGARFTSAKRCNDCGAYADPREKAELELERMLWGEAFAEGLSVSEAQEQVERKLNLPPANSSS